MKGFTTVAVATLTVLTTSVLAATSTLEPPSALPTVDLGYRLQRATVLNTTGQYYNFSNIRYAAPPTGDLRFRAPQPPQPDRSTVFTGDVGRVCPQANPAWEAIATQFLVEYFGYGKTNFTPADFNTTTAGGAVAEDPRTDEDCLFLDVMVPTGIFDRRNQTGRGAPVLVWIYGGGYTAGSKEGSGNPAGLLARSEDGGNGTGVVYVALNYRLGAFGWLAGPSLQDDGVANAGLYDQRLALEWVREHIGKFGGDPDRVTVLGESAGGGSIMHQITAFGGQRGAAPFQQAILQSPGFQPVVSPAVQENTTQTYLRLLNVSTLAQARRLPYQALQAANVAQVAASPYGQFTYGPVVDGLFAPQLPGQLLARGQFDRSLRVMVGHNSNEGIFFTSPYIRLPADVSALLLSALPTLRAQPHALAHILSALYPAAAFAGDQLLRAAALIADANFACNAYYLARAYADIAVDDAFAYLFAVPPAYHGQDIPYTFWNDGAGDSGAVVEPVARALQGYITSFAATGRPTPAVGDAGAPSSFPRYGPDATVQVLNVTGLAAARDPAANERCEWWQKALYY